MDNFDLKKVTPEEKFLEVEKFKRRLQDDFVAFGELLSDIKRSGAFKVKGYKTFKEFIEVEYNLAGSFASKLIDTFEIYIEEFDIDEKSLKEIGFDRLNMIKPLVKDTDISIAEGWIEEAKKLSTPELREKIKDEKEKIKAPESLKDIFIKQFVERMCVFFNCNVKEMNYKLAIYFQDADLPSIRQMIKDKQRNIEQQFEESENK